MKLKRPAILASISLLALGGLYCVFLQPVPKTTSQTKIGEEPEAPPLVIRPTESAGGITASPNEQDPVENSGAEDSSSAALPAVRANAARPPTNPMDHLAAPENRPSAAHRKPGKHAAGEEATAEATPVQPPVGIRLAPDVRLPAAAMPNDLNLNPIKQKALQDIVDEYYRTVAATGAAPESDTATATTVEENGEETRIIPNSPAVDAARNRADLRFKALFGHAAYNRMTMNTLLESRLPQAGMEP
jgi:hypothetical protein